MKLKLTNIGALIAERQLEGRENGKECSVIVKIGKPFQDEDNQSSWYCAYSIEVNSTQRLFYAAGVDSLQALRIAISMVETELTTTFRHLDLRWMGENDLGFSREL